MQLDQAPQSRPDGGSGNIHVVYLKNADATKLPKVGTTIFTVMSQLAAECGAINLSQGFPDFDGPPELREAVGRHIAAGHNQYAPMTGVAPLRQAIAQKALDCYGAQVDADSEITVTSGGTEAIFNAIHAVVRAGEEVIVLDPAYDGLEYSVMSYRSYLDKPCHFLKRSLEMST